MLSFLFFYSNKPILYVGQVNFLSLFRMNSSEGLISFPRQLLVFFLNAATHDRIIELHETRIITHLVPT